MSDLPHRAALPRARGRRLSRRPHRRGAPGRRASRCGSSIACPDGQRLLASTPTTEWREGDFGNRGDVAAALKGCDVAFHLVATTLPRSSNEDPIHDLESNLVPTVRFLAAAVESGVKKVVFASSGGTVYGIPQTVPIAETHPTQPLCSYGIHKLAIEQYLHLYHSLHGLELLRPPTRQPVRRATAGRRVSGGGGGVSRPGAARRGDHGLGRRLRRTRLRLRR